MKRLDLIQNRINKQGYNYTKIYIKKQSSIGFIFLNSLKDLNCISTTMIADLCQALKSHSSDSQIKAIIIYSNHPTIFCAGANIKQFLQNNLTEQEKIKANVFNVIQNAFNNVMVPIIAGVDGLTLGGGFQLALLCDIILCSQQSAFGFPEIKIGIIPGMGGTQRATKIIGQKNNMKMVLTGETVSGEKMAQLGIGQFVKSENFRQDSLKIVQKIVSKPLTALIAAKKAIRFSTNSNLTQGLQFQRACFYPLLNTYGAKQGIQAFLEKRKPNFGQS